MIITLVKFLLVIVLSLATFVFWQLHFSRTVIQSSDIRGRQEMAYIANYSGYHNSLILNGVNGWKEFSYGDWEVYGKSHINAWTGFASMGLPTQGALGFQYIEWDGCDAKVLAEQLQSINLISVRVESKAVDELYHSLEKHIDRRFSSGLFNKDNNLFFVTHPKDYIAWHTCNNMLIEWLDRIGVRVKGNGWAGNFIMETS